MNKRKLILGAAAALAVAGAGAAIGATKLSSPKEESAAIVKDAADQLGVQPQALSAALKKALENRVDAAVADGRLTKEQGEALKQRIEADEYPLFAGPGLGVRGHGPFGMFHELEDAAAYLGLTEAELRTQVAAGKTLADVAKAQGKSVDGLVETLLGDAKEHLASAVQAGRLTQAQADQVLADLKQRITDRVNGKAPDLPDRHRFRVPPPAFA